MILDRTIPLRYILGKVWKDLLVVMFLGLTVHFGTQHFRNYFPEMPLSIPAFLGTAISVLLSFKMNQSYDRWWEARKVWGSIVNDSRTLLLQCLGYVPGVPGLARKMAYRQIAWCYALGRSLRGQAPLEKLEALLPEEELLRAARQANKPLAILQGHVDDLAQLRASGGIDSITHTALDNTLLRLTDAMGKAERINGTVFPATYRLFLHFVIYIFVVTLSISLKDVAVIYELPLLMVISAGFLLIEKSAYHLQDPFRNRPSDTPVTAIARTIEINLRQLLGEEEVPKPEAPQSFYLM